MNFLDFLFPPYCLSCHLPSSLSFFCQSCWELCSPIDPTTRCAACFAEVQTDFCIPCKRRTFLLPFTRAVVFEPTPPTRFLCKEKGEALAGFAFYQWVQLEWDIPDIVIPMPGMELVAKAFSMFLNFGSGSPSPYYSQLDPSLFEKGLTFLILDEKSSLKTLRKTIYPLTETSPKKIFQLSLVDHDDTSYF